MRNFTFWPRLLCAVVCTFMTILVISVVLKRYIIYPPYRSLADLITHIVIAAATALVITIIPFAFWLWVWIR